MLITILTFSLVLSFALTVQNVLGFGLALLAVPLLLATGQPLFMAVFSVCTISALQGVLGAYRLRQVLPGTWCLKAAGGRLAGLFPGLALAGVLSSNGRGWSELLVAGALLVGIAAQAYRSHRLQSRPVELEPKPSKGSSWPAQIAFLASGFFMGTVGMGGPPLVFWLLNSRWSALERKAFLFGLFALTAPIQLVVMTCQEPYLAGRAAGTLLAALPVLGLVGWFTRSVGETWSQERLGAASLVLLTALAARTLWTIDYGALFC